MLRQLLFSDKMDKAETASTASCGTFEDKELQVHIECQNTLDQFWKELQQGAHRETKSIQITLHQSDPYKKISTLRRLEDVFAVVGSLPQLEEVVFINSNLLASTLSKLLKKTSLQSLKFHHCTFIAKNMEHAQEKLWKGIQLQKDLTILEILNCSYTASETLCRNRVPLVYSMPLFLQEQRSLQRLVLDECSLDNDQQEAFETLVANNTSLVELEIRPVFDASNVQRREQYQTKKQAIRTFLTETIPHCLTNNTTLKRLVVSLEDYHLEQIYVDAMCRWIDLVQHDNSTLADLRATHLPLAESSDEPDWYAQDDDEELFEYAESYLHHNLRSILRLNQMFGARQQQLQQQPQDEEESSPAKEEAPQDDASVAKTEEIVSSVEEHSELVTEIWV